MSETLLLSMPYGKSYGKIDYRDLDFWVPPVGLAYIGSFLKSKGCDVKLTDLMFTADRDEVRNLIRKESPRWLGISATTPQISEAFLTARIAKEVDSGIKVVIGGIHASALPEETIKDGNIDILVYGEGEFTMWELVKGEKMESIKGIYYKKEGRIIRNPPRELVQDIDIFPYPLYEDLPVERFGNEFFVGLLGVVSSRGCPHQCTYCAANTVHKRQYRKRSIENVMGEIEKLKYKFHAKRFSFYDDTFTLDGRRTEAICEALIRKNLGLEWHCITRADNLTKPLLTIMKRAGCTVIQIGIESGDNDILRLAKRKENVEDVLQAVMWIKEAGMEVVGLFIIGLPYETPQTIEKTIKLAKRLDLDYAQFSILVPLPGSEVWDTAKEGKLLEIISPDWENFGRYGKPIIRLRDVSEHQLFRYFTRAYREFYLRPGYVYKMIRRIKGWRDFKNLINRGLTLLKFFLR